MRKVIIGLAVVGILASGLLGMVWVSDAGKVKEAMKVAESLGVSDSPEIKAAVAKANSVATAAYLMLLGAAVATTATVLLVVKPEKAAVWGGVLIACAAVPALFAAKSLVFTFFLVVAGGLCVAQKFRATATATRPQPARAAA